MMAPTSGITMPVARTSSGIAKRIASSLVDILAGELRGKNDELIF